MGKQSKSTSTKLFTHGDRVFAKMKGYPFWPARIESTPEDLESKDKYEVLFYGTYQTIILKSEFLIPYDEETIKLYGKERKQKSFNEALWEIENDPKLEKAKENEERSEMEQDEGEEEEDDEVIDEENEETETESTESKSVKSNEEPNDTKKSNKNGKSQYERQESGSRRSSRHVKQKDEISLESNQTIESQPTIKNKKTNNKTVNESSHALRVVIEQPSSVKSRRISELNTNRKEPTRRSERSRLASNQSETSNKSDEQETIIPQNTSNSVQQDEQVPAPASDTTENNQLRRQSSRPKQPNKRYSHHSDNNSLENTQFKQKNSRKGSVNLETGETKQIKPKRKRSTSNSRLSTFSNSSTSNKSDSNKTSENFDKEENNNSNSSDQTVVESNKNESDESSSAKIKNENNEESQSSSVFKSIDLTQDDSSMSLNEANKTVDFSTKSETKEKFILKNRLKEEKTKKKKEEYIKSIRTEICLDTMDKEIKKSLRVDKTDVNRCCLIMQDLIKFPFKKKHLFKSPAIVETIRKCRKFKDSETVRQFSNEFFTRLYNMFTLTSETFMNSFEKERSKYLADNEKEIKKERIWKEKCIAEDQQTIHSLKRTSRKHSKSFNSELDQSDDFNLGIKKIKKNIEKDSANEAFEASENQRKFDCFDSEAQD